MQILYARYCPANEIRNLKWGLENQLGSSISVQAPLINRGWYLALKYHEFQYFLKQSPTELLFVLSQSS